MANQHPIDPRLTLVVVAGVTLTFVIVCLFSLFTHQKVDAALYSVMGLVAGGVLGYGVLKR